MTSLKNIPQMIIVLSSLIILPSSSQFENSTVCTEINNYENGLPLGINEITKSDYLAPIVITIGSLLKSAVHVDPSKNCDSFLYRLGGQTYLKMSLRPRGCCSHCCPIDTVEEHLTLYLAKRDKVEILPFARKRKAGTLKTIGFDNQRKTLLFLHGFTENGYYGRSVRIIVDLYLNHTQFNLLILDYSELATLPWHMEAIDNIEPVAKAVAKFVIFYHETGELSIENMHILGVSLGGQMSSQIAKKIAKFKKVARLTALDPLMTIYPYGDHALSISKEDAEFVDVMYSTSSLFGYKKPVGHANFYIECNGSLPRPGCNYSQMVEKDELALYFVCDHLRAAVMYLETLVNPFLYPVCQNVSLNLQPARQVCGYMGFAANKSTTFGEYHLETDPDWHFWKNLKTLVGM